MIAIINSPTVAGHTEETSVTGTNREMVHIITIEEVQIIEETITIITGVILQIIPEISMVMEIQEIVMGIFFAGTRTTTPTDDQTKCKNYKSFF